MHDLNAQKWLANHNHVKQDLSLQTEAGIDVVIISRKSKNKTMNLEKLSSAVDFKGRILSINVVSKVIICFELNGMHYT